MLQFLRKLFCFHAYEFDYDDKHGYTQECRKCVKMINEFSILVDVV